MKRSEELRLLMERHRKTKQYACGMCPSCYQREACPGGSDGRTCENYLAPEPTRGEWREIYREAVRRLREPCDITTRIHRIGRVNGLRDAMLQIHGFTPEEIGAIEEAAR